MVLRVQEAVSLRLDEIYRYTRDRWGTEQADRYITDLFAAFDRIDRHGVAAEVVNKVYEGGLTIVDRLKDGHVALVMNTTEGPQAVEDSRDIRAVALYDKIPYFTTAAASHAAALAMQAREEGDVGVRSLQG